MSLDPNLRDLLDGTPIAHVATVLPDGAPHSVPMWIGVHGEHVVIMTGPRSQKACNLRRDPRVAISLAPPDDPCISLSCFAGRSSGGLMARRHGRSSMRSRTSTSAHPTVVTKTGSWA